MNEHPAESGDVDPVPPVGACDLVDELGDEGGDPPCWAHLFEVPEPDSLSADEVRRERRP